MGSRVQDWMTRDAICVMEDSAALAAFDLMVEHGIRHLPVLDARKKVIGILSIDDLRAAFPFDVSPKRPLGPLERDQARDSRVSDVMTWAPQTVHASASLEEAARLLAQHRIGCLPVVDEEQRLIGILSETDALRALEALVRGAPAAREGLHVETPVDALSAERERLIEQLAKWQHAEGALSADVVSALEPLSERAARRLRAIDRALDGAEHGRFGICELCQRRIPATRLRAIPEATLCVRCARTSTEEEHHART